VFFKIHNEHYQIVCFMSLIFFVAVVLRMISFGCDYCWTLQLSHFDHKVLYSLMTQPFLSGWHNPFLPYITCSSICFKGKYRNISFLIHMQPLRNLDLPWSVDLFSIEIPDSCIQFRAFGYRFRPSCMSCGFECQDMFYKLIAL
jgi:hypothetical protein